MCLHVVLLPESNQRLSGRKASYRYRVPCAPVSAAEGRDRTLLFDNLDYITIIFLCFNYVSLSLCLCYNFHSCYVSWNPYAWNSTCFFDVIFCCYTMTQFPDGIFKVSSNPVGSNYIRTSLVLMCLGLCMFHLPPSYNILILERSGNSVWLVGVYS